MLDNFFTTLSSSHFDSNDFWFTNDPDKGATGLGLGWPEDLPPTFEGSTTTFPPYPPISHKFSRDGVFRDTRASLSSDVIAAASMLYQNGTNEADPLSAFTDQAFSGNVVENLNGSGPRVKRARLDTSLGSRGSPLGLSHKPLPFMGKGVHTTKMYFDPEPSTSLDQQTAVKESPLQWGSDTGFVDHGYLAPPDIPSEEDRTSGLLHSLDCLESQSSTANTRPSSPTRKYRDRNGTDWSSLNSSASRKQLLVGNRDRMVDDSRPRKIRRGKPREDDDDIDHLHRESTNNRPPKSRRFSSNKDRPRKLKAQGSMTKQGRENLTEEQKRTNHILSEQKRRNLIKQGFDDLCALVPELNGGGFSKSTMLIQAAEWLEDLLRGNEQLKAQLAELKGQSVNTMPR
jgi:hypothetical protein